MNTRSNVWNQRRLRAAIAAVATLAGLCGGCWRPEQPSVTELSEGLIWMFPGIEGRSWQLQGAYRSLRDTGVQSAIRVYEWPTGSSAMDNLKQYDRNRAEASRVAGEIARYRTDYPSQPIDLVGYSGGGGLAVMVAESLPETVRVRNVVLAQPALSPVYDLTPAIRRMEGKLVNFYSTHDWLVLGWGTKTFGTIDRRFVPSAGRDGFDPATAVREPAARERLVQLAWHDSMAREGHDGGHFGIIAYDWNRRNIAPWLNPRVRSPSESAVLGSR